MLFPTSPGIGPTGTGQRVQITSLLYHMISVPAFIIRYEDSLLRPHSRTKMIKCHLSCLHHFFEYYFLDYCCNIYYPPYHWRNRTSGLFFLLLLLLSFKSWRLANHFMCSEVHTFFYSSAPRSCNSTIITLGKIGHCCLRMWRIMALWSCTSWFIGICCLRTGRRSDWEGHS